MNAPSCARSSEQLRAFTWLCTKYPRLQILTVKELLDGKRIDYPIRSGNVTLKQARRADEKAEETKLF